MRTTTLHTAQRAFEAMMQMDKIDIAKIKAAIAPSGAKTKK